MKRIAIIAIMLLTAATALAQNGRNLYRKYSDAEGVSAVYISPAMFRMIGKIPDMKIEDDNVNLGPLIQSLSGFYLLSSKNPDVNAKLKAETDNMLDRGNFEMLMEAKEDGETVRMYTIGDERTITSFVMIALDGEELTFILLDGRMDRGDVEQLIADAAK